MSPTLTVSWEFYFNGWELSSPMAWKGVRSLSWCPFPWGPSDLRCPQTSAPYILKATKKARHCSTLPDHEQCAWVPASALVTEAIFNCLHSNFCLGAPVESHSCTKWNMPGVGLRPRPNLISHQSCQNKDVYKAFFTQVVSPYMKPFVMLKKSSLN